MNILISIVNVISSIVLYEYFSTSEINSYHLCFADIICLSSIHQQYKSNKRFGNIFTYCSVDRCHSMGRTLQAAKDTGMNMFDLLLQSLHEQGLPEGLFRNDDWALQELQ